LQKRVSFSLPTVPPFEFEAKNLSDRCSSIVLPTQKFLSICKYFESDFGLVIPPLLPIRRRLLKFANDHFPAPPSFEGNVEDCILRKSES